MNIRLKPDALWPTYQTIKRETSMTEQKRRIEDQLPEQRLDWEHDGEPSSDPIRIERQQALLNYAAGLLKAERAECSAVVFPESDPAQYVMIGTADDILGLLPLPGASDGILRSQIRDLTTLLIDRQPADHLLDDPDLVRLLAALTAMAVQTSRAQRTTEWESAAPVGMELFAAPVAATEQATELHRSIERIADELELEASSYEGDFADTVNGCSDALRLIADRLLATPVDAGAEQKKAIEQVRNALTLAMAICDAVPNRAHLSPEHDPLRHLGKLVNFQEDTCAHGYAVIRNAQDWLEVLARLSTSGAPVTAEPVAWLEAEPSARGMQAKDVLCSMMYSTRVHTSGAPCTSNPVWPLYAAPVSAPAPADRDAIRNEAYEDAAALCDRFAKREMHPAECAGAIRMMKSKSMVRAADAAETRNAKGGDHGN